MIPPDMVTRCLCVLLLLVTTSSYGRVVMDESLSQIDLTQAWQYQLSQNFDTSTPPREGYLPVDPRPEAFNQYNRAYWLHVELTNSSAEALTRWLEIENHRIRLARLLIFENDVLISQQDAGLSIPGSATSASTNHPLFKINLPPDKRIDLYLHISSRDTLVWKSTLWEPLAFTSHLTDRRALLTLLLGIIAALAIYNLVFAVVTRQGLYLHLSAFLSTLLVLQITLQGLGSVYIWTQQPGFDIYIFGPAIMLFGLSLVIFSQAFLRIQDEPFQRRVRQVTLLYTLLFIIPVTLAQDGRAIVAAGFLYALPLAILGAQAVRQAVQGVRVARDYVLAFSPLIMLIAVLLTNRVFGFGWHSDFTSLLLLLCSVLVAMFLAVALASHIRTLANDQHKAEQATVLAQIEAAQSSLKAETAESAAAAKTAFLATMSHEIRTPMNGVLGMADLLENTPLNSQQSTYVETLRRCGQTLMNILNDILDFSKVEAGHMTLECIEVDLVALLDDLVVLHRDQINRRGLSLYVWIAAEVPARVTTDPTRLQQVLSNLLNNAIKFTETGNIIIRLDRIDTPNMPATQLQFQIIDEGIGMDSAALDNLFSAFAQADSSISRRFGGTGLGLAISKRLVELMGGHISAHSQPGKGTNMSFTIDAPAADASNIGKRSLNLGYVGHDHHLAESLRLFAEHRQIIFKRYDQHQFGQISPDLSLILDADQSLPEIPNRQLIVGKDLQLPLVFVELLNLLGETPAQEPVFPKDLQPLESMQVLLAEDNRVNRLVAGKLLERLGATVHYANDGQQALTLFDTLQDKLDVVLMDCEMPVMDGYTATKTIRSRYIDQRAIPVIALTAHALDEYRKKAIEAGMDDYVTKPIDAQVLIEAIKRCCPATSPGPPPG
jgi:two-component system, sensor histidine kinase RetS